MRRGEIVGCGGVISAMIDRDLAKLVQMLDKGVEPGSRR